MTGPRGRLLGETRDSGPVPARPACPGELSAGPPATSRCAGAGRAGRDGRPRTPPCRARPDGQARDSARRSIIRGLPRASRWISSSCRLRAAGAAVTPSNSRASSRSSGIRWTCSASRIAQASRRRVASSRANSVRPRTIMAANPDGRPSEPARMWSLLPHGRGAAMGLVDDQEPAPAVRWSRPRGPPGSSIAPTRVDPSSADPGRPRPVGGTPGRRGPRSTRRQSARQPAGSSSTSRSTSQVLPAPGSPVISTGPFRPACTTDVQPRSRSSARRRELETARLGRIAGPSAASLLSLVHGPLSRSGLLDSSIFRGPPRSPALESLVLAPWR